MREFILFFLRKEKEIKNKKMKATGTNGVLNNTSSQMVAGVIEDLISDPNYQRYGKCDSLMNIHAEESLFY